MGIVLVVLGHVNRGLVNSEILEGGGWVRTLDSSIYAFHMHLFFFLSGVFAPRRKGRSWREFLGLQARAIVYPYFVWSILQTGVQIALSSRTNNPATIGDLLGIFYQPVMQFWFLYALFLVSIVFQLMQRTLPSPLMCLVFACALAVGRNFVDQPMWSPLAQTLRYLPYFAAGAFLAPRLRVTAQLEPLTGVLVSFASFVLVYLGVKHLGVLSAVYAMAGIIGAGALSVALTRWRVHSTLSMLGKYSLEIYVAHTLASAGCRIGLLALNVDHAGIHWLLGMICGLGLPLLLVKTSNELNVAYLFSLKSAPLKKARAVG